MQAEPLAIELKVTTRDKEVNYLLVSDLSSENTRANVACPEKIWGSSQMVGYNRGDVRSGETGVF